METTKTECLMCDGAGRLHRGTCPYCAGIGVVVVGAYVPAKVPSVDATYAELPVIR